MRGDYVRLSPGNLMLNICHWNRDRTAQKEHELHRHHLIQEERDVLIDELLLSQRYHVLKCDVVSGEYALWFNPDLEYTEFAP